MTGILSFKQFVFNRLLLSYLFVFTLAQKVYCGVLILMDRAGVVSEVDYDATNPEPMDLSTVATLGAVVLTIAWFFLRGVLMYGHWRKMGIPCAETSWVFGSMKEMVLGRKHAGEICRDIYRQFEGLAYCGFYKFWTPVLLIRDPEMVNTVMVTQFCSFRDNEIHVSPKVDPWSGWNPFFLRGERWKVVRSQLTPKFTSEKLKDMFPLMLEVSRDMKQWLMKNADAVDAKDLASNYTSDLIASLAFGVRGESFRDPDADFRRIGGQLMELTPWKAFKFMVIMVWPEMAQFLRLGVVDQDAGEFFSGSLKTILELRAKTKLRRNDFLQLLIDMKQKEANLAAPEKADSPEHAFTDDDIIGHVVAFFVNGFDTTSTAVTFALLSVAENPHVQKRLRAEVRSTLERHGGELDYDAVSSMSYLDMVVSESMRMYPIGGMLGRVVTEPFELPHGGCLEVGTPVLIPVYALHHDPELFPNPSTFDPERFSKERRDSIRRGAFVQFGDGPRACPVARFALAAVKLAVAYIVADFEIHVNRRTSLPIRIDPRNWMFAVKGGAWLDFRAL